MLCLVKQNRKYFLKEEKYNELTAIEKKNNLTSKKLDYYKVDNIEKSRFRTPGKMVKINN
jgi:hypothetical protein